MSSKRPRSGSSKAAKRPKGMQSITSFFVKSSVGKKPTQEPLETIVEEPPIPEPESANVEETDKTVPMEEELPPSAFVQSTERHQKYMKALVEKEFVESRQGVEATSSKKSAQFDVFEPHKKHTPLEAQVVAIKKKHMDTLLCVEVGYKYCFFGEDARIASRVLGIMTYPRGNFSSASVPVHRVSLHIRRLVEAGYKVGVVKQTETAALKAVGSTKSKLFTRAITAMYSKATLVGEGLDPLDEATPVDSCGFMVCLYESDHLGGGSEQPLPKERSPKDVMIHLVAVQPSTGQLIWDSFRDGHMRDGLETRLRHLRAVELLRPAWLSMQSEVVLRFVGVQASAPVPELGSSSQGMRAEVLEDRLWEWSSVKRDLDLFFAEFPSEESEHPALKKVLDMPRGCAVCVRALAEHLKAFGVHGTLALPEAFRQWSGKEAFMSLGATTMQQLDIVQNHATGQSRGSLLSFLNHTKTSFGGRLLAHWVQYPLVEVDSIIQRQEAVQALVKGKVEALSKLSNVLSKVPDVERGLARMHYGKCSPHEFLQVVQGLERALMALPWGRDRGEGWPSRLLISIVQNVPDLRMVVRNALDALHVPEKQRVSLPAVGNPGLRAKLQGDAQRVDLTMIFREDPPRLQELKRMIATVKEKLDDHLADIQQALKMPSLEYKFISKDEYLIEIRNSHISKVPDDWIRVNKTKAASRFHTPTIKELLGELDRNREMLESAAVEAWSRFLQSFCANYADLRKVVRALAELDCLFSLAKVAQLPGYCCPTMVQEPRVLEIVEGRHPLVEAAFQGGLQFVPNTTTLEQGCEIAQIITGPNMGGKSSYIRQVALICIMAQVGSFVPASSARLSVLDGVFSRMGASDEIARGASTFMVELQETSLILQNATERSLVILDELGRGTATHDGMCIAYSVLHHLIDQVGCMTLFVTHYPFLGEVARVFPDRVGMHYMAFLVDHDKEDEHSITFLYKLTRGGAQKSYGLNVARLAALPKAVIERAGVQSLEMEQVTEERKVLQLLEDFDLCRAKVHDCVNAKEGSMEALQSFVQERRSGYEGDIAMIQ